MSGDGLLDRLDRGPVVCAEGYLFEFERRGYLQAGAFVPEVVLEHPQLVTALHEEFVHAGSDVVLAFTYYGHREKLRIIGKEDLLEPLNRDALALAGGVARRTGTLLAGDLCNTNAYAPDEGRLRRRRDLLLPRRGAAGAGRDPRARPAVGGHARLPPRARDPRRLLAGRGVPPARAGGR